MGSSSTSPSTTSIGVSNDVVAGTPADAPRAARARTVAGTAGDSGDPGCRARAESAALRAAPARASGPGSRGPAAHPGSASGAAARLHPASARRGIRPIVAVRRSGRDAAAAAPRTLRAAGSGGPAAPPPAPTAAPSPFEATTPERTLTRRELRAMLDANAPGDFHDLDLDDEPRSGEPAPAAPQAASPVPAPAANPFASPPVPTRAPAPHQVADAAIADEPVAAPKPVGHWTDQLNLPADRAEPFDQLLSRGGVSHGVPTTTQRAHPPDAARHRADGQPARERAARSSSPARSTCRGASEPPASTRARSTRPTSTACSTRWRTAPASAHRSPPRARSAPRMRRAR